MTFGGELIPNTLWSLSTRIGEENKTYLYHFADMVSEDIYAVVTDDRHKALDVQKVSFSDMSKGQDITPNFSFNKPEQAKYIDFYCIGTQDGNGGTAVPGQYLVMRYSVNHPLAKVFFNTKTNYPYLGDGQIYTIKGRNSSMISRASPGLPGLSR